MRILETGLLQSFRAANLCDSLRYLQGFDVFRQVTDSELHLPFEGVPCALLKEYISPDRHFPRAMSRDSQISL
jgi:hypothetical protein